MSKPWLEQLRERAEASLADIEHLLGYEEMREPDGTVRMGPDGKPIMVSRCSEASRVKLNMALIGMHPESPKNDSGTSIKFEISGEVVRLAFETAGQAERAAFIDVKPAALALPVAAAREE